MKKVNVIDIFNKTYTMRMVDKLINDPQKTEGFEFFQDTAELNGKKYTNAFEFLRDVKYSWLDSEEDQKKQKDRRESYKAGKKFVSNLEDIKELAFNEKFGEGREWIKDLEMTENGEIVQRRENLENIFKNDANLHGIFFNELTGKRMYKAGFLREKGSGPWRDGNEHELYIYLDKEYNFTARVVIADVLGALFDRNVINPVREYLENLPPWDEVERVETLFCTYLGAENNSHNRIVTRRKMIATVARILKPGCKHDECLILTGDQGMGKSTLLRILAKEESDWFNERLGDLDKRDTLMEIQKWIIEAAELDSLRKAEATELKSFISRTVDTFKMPYAHNTVDKPRCCSFFGTTNAVTDIISDSTGGRRFWIVACNKNAATKDVHEDLLGEVDQIWAEALYYYQSGEQWHLTKEEEVLAKKVQAFYSAEIPHHGRIQDYLDRVLPTNWDKMSRNEKVNYFVMNEIDSINHSYKRDCVCAEEIWEECLNLGKNQLLDKPRRNEISTAMSHMEGWRRASGTKRFGSHGTQRYWERI